MQRDQEKEEVEKRASQEAEPLQPYEQQRKDNIARNERVLSQIQQGLQSAAQGVWQHQQQQMVPVKEKNPSEEPILVAASAPSSVYTTAAEALPAQPAPSSAGGSEGTANMQAPLQTAPMTKLVTDTKQVAADSDVLLSDVSPSSGEEPEGTVRLQAHSQRAAAPMVKPITDTRQAVTHGRAPVSGISPRSVGEAEGNANKQVPSQKATASVIELVTAAAQAAAERKAPAADAFPKSEIGARPQVPAQQPSGAPIEPNTDAAQGTADSQTPAVDASPGYAGVVAGSQRIAGNLEHKTAVPNKKVQPHRTCKKPKPKPKPAQISKHAKAQGNDGAASACGAEGNHGGSPDILGPSAEEQLPASASGSSKAKGESLKRAHRKRCDQSQQKPVKQLSKPSKRRKKSVA